MQTPETEFRISISKGSVHFEIGGSPLTLESLSAKQWPFSPFGCATHGAVSGMNSLKRKSQFKDGGVAKKQYT